MTPAGTIRRSFLEAPALDRPPNHKKRECECKRDRDQSASATPTIPVVDRWIRAVEATAVPAKPACVHGIEVQRESADENHAEKKARCRPPTRFSLHPRKSTDTGHDPNVPFQRTVRRWVGIGMCTTPMTMATSSPVPTASAVILR